MSYGQAPFITNYSANTSSLVNVGSEETANEDDLITFIKGTAGRGKKLYVDTTFKYNPYQGLLTVYALSADEVRGITTNVDVLQIADTAGMFYSVQMRMTNSAGRLIIEPYDATIFPYNAGQAVIDGYGGITVSGALCAFSFTDRSTADFFQQYSDAGIFTIKSNGSFGQVNFELSTAGLASLYGTSAGLRFFERSASPTNYYSLFTSATGSVFNLTYNGTSIATIGTTGITTLVPQRIQNTLNTGATVQHITFVPLSATTTAGQVIGTSSTLTYVPSTGTLTSTAFVGALTGSATLIDTTLSSSATNQFLTFVPLSATTPAGQAVGTNASLSYVPSTGSLGTTQISLAGTNIISVSGTRTLFSGGSGISVNSGISVGTSYSGTGVVGLSGICNAGATDFIQIYDSTITTQIFNLNGTRITTTLPITAPSFTGSLTGSASLIDTTQQSAGTYYLTLAPLTTSQPNGQILYTGIVSYQYLSGTNGVMINRGSYRMLDRSNGTNFFWDIFTTTGNSLTFDYNSGTKQINISTAGVLSGLSGISRLTNALYIGTTDGYAVGSVPLAMLNNTIASGAYNNIQLGQGSSAYNSWFLGARYNVGTSSTIFSLAPYGVSQTGCWYVDGDGNTNQAGIATASAVISNNGIECKNQIIYDLFNPTQYFYIYHNSGQLIFNNLWSPLNVPLLVDGNGAGVSIYNLKVAGYSPALAATIELDTPIITEEVNGNGIAYVPTTATDYAPQATKTSPTSTVSGALITMEVQACNPNNKYLEVSFPLNGFNNFTRTSGTFTIDVSLTALTVSMTRNGVNFTNFAYDKPALPATYRYTMTAGTTFTNIQQPFFMLDIFFAPTDSVVLGVPSVDTYIIKIVPTFSALVFSGVGTRTGLNGGSGFDIDIGTAHSTAPANFTFVTADPVPTSALAITKNQSTTQATLVSRYLNTEFINLTYYRNFTSEVSSFEPLCFIGGFTYYDITLNFTSAPTAYTAVSFGLATNIGDYLLTGYNGLTALLGSAYSTVAWTNSAFIAYVPAQTHHPLKWTISNPNSARRKIITGTNNGSASAVIDDIPFVASGQNTTTTAYNSCWWSVVGTAVNGNITICGRNA